MPFEDGTKLDTLLAVIPSNPEVLFHLRTGFWRALNGNGVYLHVYGDSLENSHIIKAPEVLHADELYAKLFVEFPLEGLTVCFISFNSAARDDALYAAVGRVFPHHQEFSVPKENGSDFMNFLAIGRHGG